MDPAVGGAGRHTPVRLTVSSAVTAPQRRPGAQDQAENDGSPSPQWDPKPPSPRLIENEMRGGGDRDRIGCIGLRPIDPEEMEARSGPALVAARAGEIVQ